MPELPEVERARAAMEAAALGRRIATVEDSDTFVCRPHAPGEIAAALVGRRLTRAHRRGKAMWLETDGGPDLGLHLGMAGAILIDGPGPPHAWDRFTIGFQDGGRLVLRDRRRLSRAVLDPDLSALGPDAAEVGRDEFRRRIGSGRAPIKARLLDQSAVAGVGNLLADESLWRARISPLWPAGSLSDRQLDELRRSVRAAAREAIRDGGSHTGRFMPARYPGGACPRCGAALERTTVGGRTTFWCPRDQPPPVDALRIGARAAGRSQPPPDGRPSALSGRSRPLSGGGAARARRRGGS